MTDLRSLSLQQVRAALRHSGYDPNEIFEVQFSCVSANGDHVYRVAYINETGTQAIGRVYIADLFGRLSADW